MFRKNPSREFTPSVRRTLGGAMLSAVVSITAFCTVAIADESTKVALVPGGPHPYFAAWEQAGVDAAKEFGLASADYKVPQKWELGLQNQLLESLVTQGYNSFR